MSRRGFTLTVVVALCRIPILIDIRDYRTLGYKCFFRVIYALINSLNNKGGEFATF